MSISSQEVHPPSEEADGSEGCPVSPILGLSMGNLDIPHLLFSVSGVRVGQIGVKYRKKNLLYLHWMFPLCFYLLHALFMWGREIFLDPGPRGCFREKTLRGISNPGGERSLKTCRRGT